MIRDNSAHRRSLAKALSWETISNLAVLGLAYAVFGHLALCCAFFAFCFVLKLGMFYIHERIWHQIPYGKINPTNAR